MLASFPGWPRLQRPTAPPSWSIALSVTVTSISSTAAVLSVRYCRPSAFDGVSEFRRPIHVRWL
jgi:hypothetical protein